MLSSELVRSYKDFIRQQAAVVAPAVISEREADLSLPFLSWCYFNRKNLADRSNLNALIENDLLRNRSIAGNNSILSDSVAIFPEKNSLYKHACSIIMDYWPEFYNVVDVIKPRISLPLESDTFESASDPKTFGEITYRMDSDCPLKWAEILVHEIGHQYLNIVLTTKKNKEVFSQPWAQEDRSEIRGEQRPLIGIYHGVFAEACMLFLAINILDKSQTLIHIKGAQRIFDRYKICFEKDLSIIRKYGVLEFDKSIQGIIEQTESRLNGYK